MNFQPRTEKEINASKLLPAGEYSFEILAAVETKSRSSGNPMIELKIRVSDGNGRSRMVSDFLVPANLDKLRKCCLACGLIDRYEAGAVCAGDFKGKRGSLQLKIEKGTNGYQDKNAVARFLTKLPAVRAGSR
jgi:hypothetical protein